MKRWIIAIAIGGGVFATVFGAAAALTVTGGGAQSGTTGATCDNNGVNVTYQDPDNDGSFETATVRGIDCSGTLDVHVEGQDGANAVLAAGSNPAGGSGTTVVTLSNELASTEVATLDHTMVNIVQTGP